VGKRESTESLGGGSRRRFFPYKERGKVMLNGAERQRTLGGGGFDGGSGRIDATNTSSHKERRREDVQGDAGGGGE